MENVQGQPLEIHPLGSLEKRADLVYYDGPVLALSESPSGDPYLHLWCDVDDNTNRWLVFRVTREQLSRYINHLGTLRQIVISPPDGFLYLADVRNDLTYAAVQLVLPTALPDSYVPPQEAIEYLEMYRDDGPENEGWQSPELKALITRLRDALTS